MSDDNKSYFKKSDTMMYSRYELEKRSFIQYVCDAWCDDLDVKGFYCELTSHPLYSYLLLKFRKGKVTLDKSSEKALREYVKVLWEEVKERVRQEEIIFICQECNKDMDYCECPACCVDCGKIHPFEECECV